ncbi:BRO-N domain-containing protein [Clostridium saudiense]|uniref:BRO-N domain-containing protein n=1 Tax=Clostridium saudiense TaxID=1414720 RepID=UPI0018AA6494|nr:BRO family protein [Clostridium saudiense]
MDNKKHQRRKDVQLFINKELELEVRAVEINGEGWLVGKDVAEVLGYSNTAKAIRDHVDIEDKLSERIVLSGQNREVILINESGFYSLILRSEMPKAKQFKRWVTAEVLPQIRKTGGYSPNNQLALSEFKGQVIAMVNDIVSEKINEVEDKYSEFYKINAAKKYDVSQYIKRRLGINKANDEYHQVKDRVFLLLNVTKWEDIDIDTFKESIDIIDESIRVIKMERPYEQTRFNL